MFNKSSKEVEVIADHVHLDEDDSVGCSKGEDGRGGESGAGEVAMGFISHPLSMDEAVVFLTEVRVFGDVCVSEVSSSTWDKIVKISVLPEEEVVGGKDASGHAGYWSSRARVLILLGCP